MKINEKKIVRIVNDCVTHLLNEAMSDGFSFDELKNIGTFSGRMRYCKEKLGFPIGSGSSRVCFQLDDDRILKLARNEKGIAQNEVEGRIDYYLDGLDIRPEIFDETDFQNNLFIVCEYVR